MNIRLFTILSLTFLEGDYYINLKPVFQRNYSVEHFGGLVISPLSMLGNGLCQYHNVFVRSDTSGWSLIYRLQQHWEGNKYGSCKHFAELKNNNNFVREWFFNMLTVDHGLGRRSGGLCEMMGMPIARSYAASRASSRAPAARTVDSLSLIHI